MDTRDALDGFGEFWRDVTRLLHSPRSLRGMSRPLGFRMNGARTAADRPDANGVRMRRVRLSDNPWSRHSAAPSTRRNLQGKIGWRRTTFATARRNPSPYRTLAAVEIRHRYVPPLQACSPPARRTRSFVSAAVHTYGPVCSLSSYVPGHRPAHMCARSFQTLDRRRGDMPCGRTPFGGRKASKTGGRNETPTPRRNSPTNVSASQQDAS